MTTVFLAATVVVAGLTIRSQLRRRQRRFDSHRWETIRQRATTQKE